MVVSRSNSSRSRADNLTGRFFCEGTRTVLVRQGNDLPHNSIPVRQARTKQRHHTRPCFLAYWPWPFLAFKAGTAIGFQIAQVVQPITVREREYPGRLLRGELPDGREADQRRAIVAFVGQRCDYVHPALTSSTWTAALSYLNRPMARAITRATVTRETTDWIIMTKLARPVNARTSVGLNAVALV